MKLRVFSLLSAPLLALQPALAIAGEEPQSAIAPDRLEAARNTIEAVFPDGTYARIMQRSMDAMMDSAMASVGDMPLRDIASATGKNSEELEAMGDATLKEMLDILDPAYAERMELTLAAMSTQMTAMMSEFEPSFQDGLARAYARRFDTAQLAELNAFFATPTGRAYANESMTLMTDPEVMGKLREIMPAMIKKMPQLMKVMTEATDHLPSPRKPEDLTEAEQEQLARLLGEPAPDFSD